MIKLIIFGALFFSSMIYFIKNVIRLIDRLKLGKPAQRTDQKWKRTLNVLSIAFGQKKLLREPLAGMMHFVIFWGFIVLLLAIVETIGEGFYPGFSLSFVGIFYYPLEILQEIMGMIVVLTVLVALLRRYLFPPKRLQVKGHALVDATLILSTIFLIMISMFGENSAQMAISNDGPASGKFLSAQLSTLFQRLSPDQKNIWYEIFWWLHVTLVLGLMNYLPFSKHLHILSSIPNVFLAKLENRSNLRPLDLADPNAVRFGASDVEDLSWKQLLDGYTCTECGRCTSACPANITGKLLSPKKIIVDIKQRLFQKASLIESDNLIFAEGAWRNQSGDPAGDEILGKGLVDNFITEDELWACTTCMACVQECPVQIEHIDSIVDMRRYLVLNESRFPKEMQVVFQNLERNYAPWAFSHSSRADWADGLDIPLMAEKKKTDILFWVGCAGAYDERYKKVSKAFAQIMNAAGVDFAILGTEEKCNGDPARRAGNEYLAQTLISENILTLGKYQFNKILTTCPHCFNTIKNEYPDFGGRYEVMHHADYIKDLLAGGRLKLRKLPEAKVTYHDSCYLGRYNGIYDSPREILSAVPGLKREEMRRSGDKGFCCGAGGARMFMEEKEGKRVNHERVEEALGLDPGIISTACPFCMTMMSDGVKDKNMADKVAVKDIAEIISDSLEADKKE